MATPPIYPDATETLRQSQQILDTLHEALRSTQIQLQLSREALASSRELLAMVSALSSPVASEPRELD